MKNIIVTKSITEDEARNYIDSVQKGKHSHNRCSENDIESFVRGIPKVGETVILQNSQYHFQKSYIFAGWVSFKYGNYVCLDIESNGVVSMGRWQGRGHS